MTAKRIWPWALALFWILMLYPYLINGYWGDDALNSSVRGEALLAGTSVFGFMRRINDLWMFQKGRLYPLSWFFVYGSFAVFHTLKAFRIYQCSLLVANVGLFAGILKKIGLDKKAVLLFLVLLPAFFQVRNYHDPIASYAGLLQVVGIESCLALLGLLGWLERKGIASLILFCTCFAASLLTYEVSLIFIPIYAYFILTRSEKARRIQIAIPAVFILAAYGGVSLYLRAHASESYPGTDFGSFSAFFLTFLKQVTAGLPLSYLAIFRLNLTFGSVVAGVLGGALLFAKSGESEKNEARNTEAWIVGLVLVLVSSAIIGISKRYQEELTWGIGYLPVYFCCFGFALLASLKIGRWESLQARSILTVAFACIIALTRSENLFVVDHKDAVDRELRLSLESSLERGLLDSVSDGSKVVLEPISPYWASSAFFLQHSGKRLVVDNDMSFTKRVGLSSSDGPTYDLRFTPGSRQRNTPSEWHTSARPPEH